MGERRHGVVQVRDLPCAAAECLAGRVVIRLGVGERDADLAGQLLDGLHRTGQLGRKVAQLEQTVRLRLHAAEHRGVRCVQIGAVLRALFLFRDERPLHIDADERGLVRLCAPCGGGLRDLRQLFLGIGHGRRTDGGDAVLRLIGGKSRDRFGRAVAEIASHAAVEVQIDQAGNGVKTVHVHCIAGLPGGKNAVIRDRETARAERAVGLIDFQIAELHEISPQRRSVQRESAASSATMETSV